MRRAALIAGVNMYEDPEINRLDYAENDAIDIYSYFNNRPEYNLVEQMCLFWPKWQNTKRRGACERAIQ